MASTTLYAPQVPAVQPAFVYNKNSGEVFINFSFSAFNSIDDISTIELKIIDPNISSVDGNNIIVDWSTITSLNENENNYIAKYNINGLNTNQYYQVQLRFVKYNMPGAPDERSSVSQVTLIYPIDEILITEYNIGNFQNKIINQGIDYKIVINSDNKEKIYSYYFSFTETGVDKPNTFKSPVIKTDTVSSQYLGILPEFLPDGEFSVKFCYTTIHGYQGEENLYDENNPINYFIADSEDSVNLNLDLREHPDLGVSTLSWNTLIHSEVALQIEEKPSIWKTLIYTEQQRVGITFLTMGQYVLKEPVAKYRFIVGDRNEYKTTALRTIELDYEDIFLSDENILMSIRYNPAITGFKWVKQESITNTFGGKYPLIRVNADTDYRQFNLSGTLFCDNVGSIAESILDSEKDITSLFTTSYDLYCNDFVLQSTSKRSAETEARHILEGFLKNGKPKLFRSIEEGNMIVYLSNVSFTPNKQLGRHVYDFSATVTELCDYTQENMDKYKVNIITGLPSVHLDANVEVEDDRNHPVLIVTEDN